MSTQFSVEIQRPVNEVFEFVSDPNNLPLWGEGITEVSVDTDNPVQTGTKFIIKNKMGGRTQEFESEVLSFEPDSEYSFKTGSGATGYISHRKFDEIGAATRITEQIDGQQSGLAKLVAPLVLGFVKKSHYNSLLKLKEVLES